MLISQAEKICDRTCFLYWLGLAVLKKECEGLIYPSTSLSLVIPGFLKARRNACSKI